MEYKKIFPKNRLFNFLLVVGLFLFFIIPSPTKAASLYLKPSVENFVVGDIFIVNILVDTQGININNGEINLNYPTDFLEVVSLNKSASIFSLWVEGPSFSNNAGTVSLVGGLPTPGFKGSSGNIISINFRAKKSGVASLIFSSSAIRANDGEGTNVLTSSGSAQFTLGKIAPAIPEATTPSIKSGTPSAVQIISPTHPDPNKWYSKKDAEFNWSLPSDATAVRLLYDKNSNSQPRVLYDPAVSEKKITSLKDGTYYFHVQLRNNNGWGGISHFRFQIDTQSPEPFDIKFVDGNETNNSRPNVLFSTTDSMSGIDRYKVKIGEGDSFNVSPNDVSNGNPYSLPIQGAGKRTILIQAFDKAGNYSTAVEDFKVIPIPPPVIKEYPKQVETGENFFVLGVSNTYKKVSVWLQKEKNDAKRFIVEANQNGEFTFTPDETLTDGVYKLWAASVNDQGVEGLPTEKINIVVEKSAIFRIGSYAVNVLAVIVPLISIVFILFLTVLYGLKKFSSLKRNLRKEIHEVESTLSKAFYLLKKTIEDQVTTLEKAGSKRDLTDEEEKIIKQLKKDLGTAERLIKKEINSIEEEIK